MPPDYTFGITAASAETPDSFEAYKFQLSSSQASKQEQPQQHQATGFQPGADAHSSMYKTSDSQFEDLHQKLQSLQQAVDKLEHDITKLQGDAESRHRETTRGLPSRDTLNTIASQSDKLDRIERTLNGFQSQFSTLRGVLKDSHDSLTEGLPKHIGNGM